MKLIWTCYKVLNMYNTNGRFTLVLNPKVLPDLKDNLAGPSHYKMKVIRLISHRADLYPDTSKKDTIKCVGTDQPANTGTIHKFVVNTTHPYNL